MTKTIIKGRKGGGSGSRTPVEQPDDLQSVAKAKILLALGEGEFAGGLTAQDIYLDGTPLENADGSQNFSGVAWEFRPGTQAQNYIQGIPGTENEISVGTEIKSDVAWTHTFTNTQLSAVRLRLKWSSLFTQTDEGDLYGNTVNYAIDRQTDGGAWETVIDTAVTGKTTSGYERSHRIDLPPSGSSWSVRLRKTSPDANSAKTGDAMVLESYTEVIDAKLRYPHTALLYIEFDSSQFNGSIPQISCEPRGRVIRVPETYDPETRDYTGTWDGTFKWAWTDNPAWIFYDLVVTDRFGLGDRLTAANIDKWILYQVAQYCDQPVPDGKGGDGTEPRYLCNVYVQDRNDAYTVLRDFAAIFRGMTYWGGDQIICLADMPRDVDFSYTHANVVDGKFTYSGSSTKSRYTTALVSYSDPANGYADAMEPVFEQDLVARYGVNQLEVTAIGCTRQSESNRKGRWGILTNNKDRVVTFSVGLDGNIPQPGYIISVADRHLSGKVAGGRIRAVDGLCVTLDRVADVAAGDRLMLNLPSGISQSRTVDSVEGAMVTVTAAYSETPAAECVWLVESDELYAQQYRVTTVKDDDDGTFTITGAAHDPDKYDRIDTGAVIDQRPISVIPAGTQAAPADISISSYSVVSQGLSVETMHVSWAAPAGAMAYEAQWRRNEGNWITVPRSATTSFEVTGVYTGRYVVRVRALNASGVSSGWASSPETTLSGKNGTPAAPLALTTTSLIHGVRLDWNFPAGAEDTQRTELQYSAAADGSGATTLSDVAYPGKSYQQMGLQMGATFWYRARIVDRLENESPWTGWMKGMASDDFDDYYEQLDDAIKDTDAWRAAQEDIQQARDNLTDTAETIRNEVAAQVDEVNQTISEAVDELNKNITDGDTTLGQKIDATENSLKQALAATDTAWADAVKQETDARITDVNEKASQAAEQLLNEKNERTAAIDNLQTIVQDAEESLAQQIAEISAGGGQQFDSYVIWHFADGNEGWSEDDAGEVPMAITDDGWLKASNSTASSRSPNDQTIPASAYRMIMLRVKKVGAPVWHGRLFWVGAGEQGWNDSRAVTIPDQEFDAEGLCVVAIRDINWNASGTIRRFRLDLAKGQDDNNYFLIDWISAGRPAPGASTAALRDEATARTNADAAEAQKRSTLAAQIRGNTDSNSLDDVRSGLLYQEMTARITADEAEVTARESLQTQFNENKASVADELSSLTTAQSAQAGKISGLEASLGDKADASALDSLTQKVEEQGDTLTSQGESLTSLTDRIGKAESGLTANSDAISGLESTVTQQGEDITSAGKAITKLQDDLSATQNTLETKADQAALTALSGRVEKTEAGLTAANSSITSLTAAVTAGKAAGDDFIPNPAFDPAYDPMGYAVLASDSDGVPVDCPYGHVAKLTARDHIPVMNNIAVTTGDVLEVSALVACGTGKAAFNFYFGVADKATGSIRANHSGGHTGATTEWIRASWRYVVPEGVTFARPFLQIDQSSPFSTVWYVTDWHCRNVTAANTAQGTADAAAKAVDSLTTTVSQQGDTLSSQGQALTQLQNSLAVTNDTLSQKADAEALDTLQSTVTQQGKTLTSAGDAITKLQNGLETTEADVSKKADASALDSLTQKVEEQGDTLTSQGSAITQLTNSLTLGNLILNGDLSGSADNWASSGSGSAWQYSADDRAIITTTPSVRLANITQIPVEPGMTLNISFEARLTEDISTGSNAALVGVISDLDNPTGWLVYADSWMAGLTSGFTTKTATVTIPETFQGQFVFLRFAQGGFTPSTARVSIRHVVVTSSTGIASKADATAVNDLATRVSDVEGKATAQATQISGLDSRVDDAASAIDGLNETVAENGLAMANGFQQLRAQVGDVQSSITTTGKAVADLETATAEQLSTMSASVGDLSSAVETQEKTVAGIDGKLSSLYSLKVETNNGKEVVAGISLGSDGETSDIILYADRFSLYNSVSGEAVPVMIAEGNELYIDTTHIKDGSITNAKISGLLASDNFDPDSTGWGINKSGDCIFSNGIFRGHIEAASGTFKGTLQADAFIGDIAVAKRYPDMAFRRNNTVTTGGAYQNRGYGMTIVLACTLVAQTYGADNKALGYAVTITFNIGGQEVSRRVHIDAGMISAGNISQEFRFAADLDADNNNVSFSVSAHGGDATNDYACSVENITATAFRTSSTSFS